MAEHQDELDGMPDPASKMKLSGTIGTPEGFFDGITKASIGQERELVVRVEIVRVGDEKQKQGKAHFVQLAAVEGLELTKAL